MLLAITPYIKSLFPVLGMPFHAFLALKNVYSFFNTQSKCYFFCETFSSPQSRKLQLFTPVVSHNTLYISLFQHLSYCLFYIYLSLPYLDYEVLEDRAISYFISGFSVPACLAHSKCLIKAL